MAANVRGAAECYRARCQFTGTCEVFRGCYPLPLRLRVRQSLHLLYCARVKRRLMPAFVLAEGKEVEMTGVLTTRS